ncbi:hypothetical protein FB451DRAFT_1387721 [Mycena latifolia]|nr:hypothetical protein FB451DRAFT_1387721 [Mycena latifolia]
MPSAGAGTTASSSSFSVVRTQMSVRDAQVGVAEVSSAATRVRRRPVTPTGGGKQLQRDEDLMWDDLYLTGTCPPVIEELLKNYHKCSICFTLKSHPVSARCGHSYCYVCIRLWLERQWTCPECKEEMHCKPTRHYPKEAYLRDAYPDWEDKSEVSLLWEGLKFPRAPKVTIIPFEREIWE